MLSTTAIVMQPMDKRYVKACVFFSIFNNPGAILENEDSKNPQFTYQITLLNKSILLS